MLSKKLNKANVNNNFKYKVSVIVPCYNVFPWIDQCLESLVNQTLESIEIIAINDGSTDGTGARLDEWQVKYPSKIKVIHKFNGGLSSARNAGIYIAQGKCIGFVDADDFIDLTMLFKLYEAIVLNNTQISYCNLQYYDDDTAIIKKLSNLNLPKIIDFKDKTQIKKFLTKIIMNLSFVCTMYTREFIQKHKLHFQQSLRLGEELCFYFQLLFQAPSIAVVDEILYNYRQNRVGQLTQINDEKLLVTVIIFDFLLKNLPTYCRIHFQKTILYKQLTLHATLASTKIKKQLLFNYLSHCSYNVFENHSILSIYKQAIMLTLKRNFRYLPFILLLNIFYFFKKKPMPNHPWLTDLF